MIVADAATRTQSVLFRYWAPITAVCLSVDGALLVCASVDGAAWVLDCATGSEVARFDHDGAVTSVVFAPDSTVIATGCDDHTAHLFDATGTQRCQFDLDGPVTCVAFSADGSTPLAGSEDGSLRLYETASERLVTRALGAMSRPLTDDELRRFAVPDPHHVREWRAMRSVREGGTGQ